MKKIFWLLASFLLPVVSFAAMTGQGTIGLPNPLAGGVDSITGFVIAVLNHVVIPIGSVIVVFFIIYSGFLFVTARGSEDKIKEAKHILKYVVIGTAVLLGSAVIAQAIQGTLCQIAPNLPDCHAQVGLLQQNGTF